MQLAGAICALVLLASFAVNPAAARPAGPRQFDFDIPAQPLPAALQRFSRTADLQIVFPYDSFAPLTSRRVRGRMTAGAALRAMVAGLPVRITVLTDHVAALAAAPVLSRRPPTAGTGDIVGPVRHRREAPDAAEVYPIVVTGRRVSRANDAIGELAPTARSAVTRAALLSAPPGISGLKMLEQLPGFNVQTDGPLGLYEFGNSVQTRAFNLDQIGFTVDGIPMGRSDVFGGSPVYRYVDNENLAIVEASPGAADVSVPGYASLGPTIAYRTIEPGTKAGLFISQAFGDDGLRRTFVRIGTGRVGPVTAYLSHTDLDSGLWRGAGTIDREHWEGRAAVDLGEHARLQLKVVANDFFDYDSPFLTKADYFSQAPDLGGQTGRRRGFIGFIPLLPPTTAGVEYSNSGHDYYYGNAFNVRRDRLYSASAGSLLAAGVEADFLVYHEDKSGYGVSADSYDNSLSFHLRQIAAGLPVTAPRGLQYGLSTLDGRRSGLRGTITVAAGRHDLSVGFWAEEDHYRRTQRRLNRQGGAPDGQVLVNETVYFRRDYRSRRSVLQLHARDRIAFAGGRGLLTLGVKALAFDYRQRGYGDVDSYALADGSPGFGPQDNGVSYADMFLPMASLVYRADSQTELFAAYAENYALPKAMDEIFAVPSPVQLAAPRPERARNIEFGVRTSRRDWFASAAIYLTGFENRIQSLAIPVPGFPGVVENYYANVGRVEAYGFEFSGTWKPPFLDGLLYVGGSLSRNVARFKGDLPDGTAIANNRIPDSPEWLFSANIVVEPTTWLVAGLTGKYTSRRFANHLNTSAVPGFAVFSAYVDIGDGLSAPPLKNVRARLNIDNLFDRQALSFILPSVAGEGQFRPLSPRAVQLTLSAEF